MPQSSNVLSFVPVPNVELGPRRNSAGSPQSRPGFNGIEDETVLRKIAEAALSATGADGAALALRRDGFVVCVARAGEMAPPLGARLDDSSGVSGECLREGQALRCDDTETDARVDAEACRSLGLRSVAVAAVREDDQVIGILEVFSPKPSAFTDRHTEVLRQLAELVIAELEAESAHLESPPIAKSPPEPSAPAMPQPRLLPVKAPDGLPEEGSVASPPVVPEEKGERAATPLPGDVNISAYMAAHEKAQSQVHPRVPKVVLVGLATLVLASFAGWYFRHWTPSGTGASAARPAAPVPSPATSPPVNAAVKPSPNISGTTVVDQSHSKPPRDSATNAAGQDRIANNSLVVTNPLRVVMKPPTGDADSETAPGLVLGNADGQGNDTVNTLLSTPVALPQRAPPVSQGVEGGELESKVAAIYPTQARAVGQHGTVVLEALVGEDGSVRDVKVVSGPPMLRQAATDAVRRWRYRPFKLNGRAIAAQTQVKVEFKLQ
jgi:TonB family protein